MNTFTTPLDLPRSRCVSPPAGSRSRTSADEQDLTHVGRRAPGQPGQHTDVEHAAATIVEQLATRSR